MEGNYIISRWNSYAADLALIPEYAEELFDVDRDKTNILVYIDQKEIDSRNINMFLALSLAKDPNFNVAITTYEDAGIAEKADVIVNLFGTYSEGFLYGLKTYDNGIRHFVNANDFAKIKSKNEFVKFIEELKNSFAMKLVEGSR